MISEEEAKGGEEMPMMREISRTWGTWGESVPNRERGLLIIRKSRVVGVNWNGDWEAQRLWATTEDDRCAEEGDEQE